MKRGNDVIEEPLWPGTSEAVEGHLTGMLLGRQKK